MDASLILKARNHNIDVHVEARAWKPAVIVGLNATLKSVTARTFTAPCLDTNIRGPSFDEYRIRYELKLIEGNEERSIDCRKWLMHIISDARISLREILAQYNTLRSIYEDLNYAIIMTETEQAKDAIESVKDKLAQLHERLVFDFVKSYVRFKQLADVRLLAKFINELDKLTEEFSSMLKETFGKAEELSPENLLPLEIKVLIIQKSEGEDVVLSIRDRRLEKEVDTRLVSSSVASILLFDLIALFMAADGYEYKLLVIEEPEEALAPPQQVLFSRYLEKCMDISKNFSTARTFVIITTHSPYIALGFKDADCYYMKFSNGMFRAEKGVPGKPFSLGDLALLTIKRGAQLDRERPNSYRLTGY